MFAKVKKNLNAVIFVCCALMVVACGNASSGNQSQSDSGSISFANGPSYTLKLGHVQVTTHPYHIGAEALASRLSELSQEKMAVSIFPSSQLGGEIDMIESAQMGNIDFVVAGTVNLTNFNPSFTVLDFPFLFKDREHAYAVLDGEYGQSKLEILKQSGLVGFGYWENGFFDIMNGKREITKIEDLRGLNIRVVQNPVYMAAFAAMGANPVPMPPAEVYTALQNGTVDGNCLSINGIYGFRFYEVQKTYMLADIFFNALPLVMSKRIYDGMPEPYQKAIAEAGEYAMKTERQASIDQEEINLAAMIKAGISTSKPANRDDWVKLMEEKVYPQFAEKVSPEEIATIKAYAK
jgi:tripartite ATP-independent transporter DctP family solute receptor